jgi:hypothetical protein
MFNEDTIPELGLMGMLMHMRMSIPNFPEQRHLTMVLWVSIQEEWWRHLCRHLHINLLQSVDT